MNDTEIKAFRESIAVTWERCGRAMGELLSAWHTQDAPPDITTGEEWPVEMALEDMESQFYAAAAKIRENDEPDEPDNTEQVRAEALVAALRALGVDAYLYWDRGPYCAQVPLRPIDKDNVYSQEETPSLFVFTEGRTILTDVVVGGDAGLRWSGAVGNIDPEPEVGDVHDVGFEFLQRTWLGDGVEKIAADVALTAGWLTRGFAP